MGIQKDRQTANLLKSYRTKPYKFSMHCSKCVSCRGTSYSRPLLIRHSPLLQNPGGATARVSRCQKGETNLGPDLRNISRQSYDYLMIMTKLRSTNEGRFNLQNILRRTQGFCQARFTCKIVRSSETVFINQLVIFLRGISARFKSRSQVDLTINLSQSYDKS